MMALTYQMRALLICIGIMAASLILLAGCSTPHATRLAESSAPLPQGADAEPAEQTTPETPAPEADSSASSEASDADDPKDQAEQGEPVSKTVVCIGDSITSGGAYSYPDQDAWPIYLQELLYGLYDDWTLVNLGVSSTTLLDEGLLPYRATGNIDVAKSIQADAMLIMLGTNDSWDPSWNEDAFHTELRALVDELHAAQPQARIVLIAPPATYSDPDPASPGVFHMDDALIGGTIRQTVQKVAQETDSRFVDLHQITEGHPEWFPDTVHPNAEGNRAIADYLFSEVFS